MEDLAIADGFIQEGLDNIQALSVFPFEIARQAQIDRYIQIATLAVSWVFINRPLGRSQLFGRRIHGS